MSGRFKLEGRRYVANFPCDARHGDASQGIGHIDSGVGQIAGLIYSLYFSSSIS